MTGFRFAAFFLLLAAADVSLGGADVVFWFLVREHGVTTAALWTALRGATLGAAGTLLLARQRSVYFPAFFVFAAIAVTDFALMATNGAGLTPSLVRAALSESHYAGGAARMFVAPAVARAIAATAVLHLLGVAARRLGRPVELRVSAAGLAALVLACALSYATPGPTWLPRLLAAPFVASRAVLRRNEPPAVVRDAVGLPAPGPPHAQHVVLLIEESVRADGFVDSTPWLHAHSRLADFGAASAAANCSAESNLVLTAGLRANELPDRDDAAHRAPTLFDHAVAAGFATWLIDAQQRTEAPPATLSHSDLRRLSGHVVLRRRGVPEADVDHALADAIVAVTAGSARTFVIANKRGAHYPYEAALPAGRAPSTSREAYRAAVEWSVDRFFASLLPRLEGRDVWLLYVSDHGESLPGDSGPPTHCREAPAPAEQRAVPLVVLRTRDTPEPTLDAIGARASPLRDGASAYQAFPTLLLVLGYDAPAILERYGPTLLEPPEARVTFSGDPHAQNPWWRTPSD